MGEVSATRNLTPARKKPPRRDIRGKEAEMATNVIEADDANFEKEVLAADVPVLVDFVARWCGPCRAMAPLVERLAAENRGRLKVVKVDADEAPRTAERYGVRGVPTLLVFRSGQRTASHLGAASKETILALLAG
jgi:thioredoxin 1